MTEPCVLVADDEPAIRRLLRTSLTPQGWRVAEAADGAETRTALQSGRVDVLLLDLGLPDIDGIELLREIRTTHPHIPIVVLSAREDERGKVAALDLGADDYVTKPFFMAELVARLRNAIRHRLQQEGTPPLFASGDLRVDLVRRQLFAAQNRDPSIPFSLHPFLPSPSGWLCLRTFRLYCRATRSPDHLASPSRQPCRQLRLSPTDNFSRLLRSPDCVLTLIERSSLPGIPHPSHPASVSPISSPIRITNILGDTGLHS